MLAPRLADEPESIYTEFDISDHLDRQRDVSRLDRSDFEPDSEAMAQLDETLDKAIDVLGERFDTVEDYVPHHPIDWVSEDDLIDSGFPGRAMVKAYILRLLSPDISGFDSLTWTLEDDPELAAAGDERSLRWP